MSDTDVAGPSGAADEIDGEATELATVDEETYQGEKPTMLEPVQQGGVIQPLDAEAVVSGMQAYQRLLPQLLSDSDYQNAGRGRRFVKKSGWRKIAKAFGLSVEIVSTKVERDGEGKPIRATVIARAIHPPTGQFSDGDGHCSYEEDRFSGPHGNQSKLENDLRATATTRAKNRAISDLVGMGDVSAEEASVAALPYGPKIEGQAGRVSNALIYLFGDDAEKVWNAITGKCDGYMPWAVGQAVMLIGKHIKEQREAEAGAPEPANDDVTDAEEVKDES